MSLRALLIAACAASLAACTTQAVRTPLPPELQAAAEARQQAREQALRAQPDWTLRGRIAMSVDRNGGSGRIDWRQAGAGYTVELSAPITRQSWRLSGDDGWARIDGLEGGARSGPDAGILLYEATGWLIPVRALGDWVRGLRAEVSGPAQVEYDTGGRLHRLSQDGWQIEYVWPAGESGSETPMLPNKVEARRQDPVGPQARVKLVIDEWVDAEEAASGAAAQ